MMSIRLALSILIIRGFRQSSWSNFGAVAFCSSTLWKGRNYVAVVTRGNSRISRNLMGIENPPRVRNLTPLASSSDKSNNPTEEKTWTDKETVEKNTISDDIATEDDTSSWPVEIVAVGACLVPVSAFILANNFIGPWPANLADWWPYRVWLLIHAVGGMLFSGGVILTTLIEWLVVSLAIDNNNNNNNNLDANLAMSEDHKTTTTTTNSVQENDNVLPVLQFWFDQVPKLDLVLVVPALTVAMFSGTGLAAVNYGSIGAAPLHIRASLHTLVTFAIWWAATDLTTQVSAKESLIQMQQNSSSSLPEQQPQQQQPPIPQVLLFRRISNVVSCIFVFVLYSFMILKPGKL